MDKKEYIDREAVLNALLYDMCGTGFQSRAMDTVRFVPAADVVEVVHGEWVYHECVSSYDGLESGYSCSCCCVFIDEEVFDNTSLPIKYCPNCGAKMDGGKV